MIYCDNCGEKLPNGANYCISCGSPVNHFVDVADIPAHLKKDGFFRGRIGRLRFFEGLGFSLFPLLALALLWVVANTTPGYWSQIIYSILLLLLLPAIVFSVTMNVGLTIRRSHDIGLSGMCAVLAYLPYIGLIYDLFIMLKRGEAKTNEYGPAPRRCDNPFDEILNYDLHQTSESLRALK